MESFEYRVLIRGWDDRGIWGWVKDGKWDKENARSSEELLTDMGRQGWELVTVITVPLRVPDSRFSTGLQ